MNKVNCHRPKTSQMAGPSEAASRPRALQKAVETLASGDFYEAQQMFKTVFHRQRSKKQLAEGYATLREGALLQLQAGHVTCGVELGLMYVDTMINDVVPPSSDNMDALLKLVQALPSKNDQAGSSGAAAGSNKENTASDGASAAGAPKPDAGAGAAQPTSDVDELVRLVTAGTKWASKMPHLSWQPMQRLHGAFAAYLWQQYGLEQLARVSQHVARSDKPSLHIQVLRAAAPPDAMDAFLTQAVLKVLAVARPPIKAAQLDHAIALWAALAPATCPASVSTASQASTAAAAAGQYAPLANFLGLLLEALGRNSLPLIKLLRDRYRACLQTDPMWSALLDRIESVYLGARPRGAAGGPLGGLLGQLMQGLGGEFEEEELFEEAQEGEEEEGEGAGQRSGLPSVRIDEVQEDKPKNS